MSKKEKKELLIMARERALEVAKISVLIRDVEFSVKQLREQYEKSRKKFSG